MTRSNGIQNAALAVLLSLTALTACSTQGPRDPQEQHGSADTSKRPETTTKDAMETAGAATAVVLVLGIALAVAAVPVLLVVLLL
jgi:hypothetical protein